MNKIVLSAGGLYALAALMAVPATAADLAARPVYRAPVIPVAGPSWTGFYMGINAGYTWSQNRSTDVVGTPLFINPACPVSCGAPTAATTGAAGATASIPSGHNNGVIGGGQIGANYQINSFVTGIEADFQGLTGRGSENLVISVLPYPGFPGSIINTGLTATRSLNWLGTVRGQLGFTLVPSLLIYGTGGLAYGGVRSDVNIGQAILLSTPGCTQCAPYGFNTSTHETRIGYAYGGGVAWKMFPYWSAKIKYLHYDLGSSGGDAGTMSNIVTAPGGAVPTGGTFYTVGVMYWRRAFGATWFAGA
jgi:outer membrane immunogenic protein